MKFFGYLTSTVTLPGHTSTLPSSSSPVIYGRWHSYYPIVRKLESDGWRAVTTLLSGIVKGGGEDVHHLSIET